MIDKGLFKFGGKIIAMGATNPVWDFGWIDPSRRTDEMREEHDKNLKSMPKFSIAGDYKDADKATMWQFSKKVNNDKHFMVFHQITGSCVGNGMGQAVWYLSAAQAVKEGSVDPKLPFYLYPYGRSRYYADGRCGRGEGSMGSTAAKAIREDGILPFDYPGLPQPTYEGGITWGQSNEMTWSDGCHASEEIMAAAKKFRVLTTAQVRTADDVKAALLNGYPCTIASNWGGQMQCSTKGDPPVLMNRHSGSWNHQMSVHGYWKHPSLGEIFYILNSWGPDTHGTDPSGAPPGGFWVMKADIDYITGQDDSFAFSQFDGFPAQKIDWIM